MRVSIPDYLINARWRIGLNTKGDSCVIAHSYTAIVKSANTQAVVLPNSGSEGFSGLDDLELELFFLSHWGKIRLGHTQHSD